MTITNELWLPTEAELTVPQEIPLSTPHFKAVAVYMHRKCENQIKEFMLLRREAEDPRKVLKEGAAVTACGVDFLKSLKKTCLKETDEYAECIDQAREGKCYITRCREPQRFLDRCVEEKLGVSRPPIGYFCKLHVHESAVPKPAPKIRDYKAEAAKVLKELPKDFILRDDYQKYTDWHVDIAERG
jgi:NADH dehydrogenase (ubiquinone) 1 alpha subcomplex subunit 8